MAEKLVDLAIGFFFDFADLDAEDEESESESESEPEDDSDDDSELEDDLADALCFGLFLVASFVRFA